MDDLDPFVFAALHELGKSYGHSGERTTDCVRFVHSILERVYATSITGVDRADIMISHGNRARPFSPIDAVVRRRLGFEIGSEETPSPRTWSIVQGWRVLEDGRIPMDNAGKLNGHCFLFYGGTRSYVLEATSGSAHWIRRLDWRTVAETYAAGVRRAQLLYPQQLHAQ